MSCSCSMIVAYLASLSSSLWSQTACNCLTLSSQSSSNLWICPSSRNRSAALSSLMLSIWVPYNIIRQPATAPAIVVTNPSTIVICFAEICPLSSATNISRPIIWLFYFGVFYLGFFLGIVRMTLARLGKGSDYSDLHSGVRGWGGTPLFSKVLVSLNFCQCLTKAKQQSHIVIL